MILFSHCLHCLVEKNHEGEMKDIEQVIYSLKFKSLVGRACQLP